MNDIDAFRAARLLIRQRDDPEMFAAGRIDDMIDAGDVEGLAAWKQILSAIRTLRQTLLCDGESVN
jgi:hypothetical protein